MTKTNIFLAWSGSMSKLHATAWSGCIPKAFKNVHVFMSDQNILSGRSWRQAIFKGVRDSDVGIVFATTENMKKPWLLFEAGALAVAKRRLIVIYLVSGKYAQLPDPLKDFDALPADQDGAERVFRLLEDQFGKSRIKFPMFWERLQGQLSP